MPRMFIRFVLPHPTAGALPHTHVPLPANRIHCRQLLPAGANGCRLIQGKARALCVTADRASEVHGTRLPVLLFPPLAPTAVICAMSSSLRVNVN